MKILEQEDAAGLRASERESERASERERREGMAEAKQRAAPPSLDGELDFTTGLSHSPSPRWVAHNSSEDDKTATSFSSSSASTSHPFFDHSNHAHHSLPARSSSRRGATRSLGMHNIAPSPQMGAYQMWTPDNQTVKEEDDSLIGHNTKPRSRFRTICVALLLCMVLLGICLLVFWLVFEPHSLSIFVQNISFQTFSLGQGQDGTGVAVETLSVQCTLLNMLTNPSRFFKVYVRGGDIDLIYSGSVLATVPIQEFELPKNSPTNVSSIVSSQDIPLYGNGPSLAEIYNARGSAPLQVEIRVRSTARVLPKIMQPKFTNSAVCNIKVGMTNYEVAGMQCAQTL